MIMIKTVIRAQIAKGILYLKILTRLINRANGLPTKEKMNARKI